MFKKIPFVFERKATISDVIALLALVAALLSYLESSIARHEAQEAIAKASTERISIQSSRLTWDYKPDVLRHVSIGRSMPSPYFVRAFWEATIINNGPQDISIVEYDVTPLSEWLPSSGPYNETYAQGMFDPETNSPIVLPFSISSGHARRIKIGSLLVISPYNISSEVTKNWNGEIPSSDTSIGDLFYDYFAKYGYDFFGNEVSPGPRGILPVDDQDIKNQELTFGIISGRGTREHEILSWY